MKPIYRAFDRFEIVLGSLAVIAILAMMVAVTADAFMRYAFNAPIHGTQDLVARYLMVAAYFGVLSQAYASGAQIRIDFLLRALPDRAQHVVEALGCFGTAILFGLIGWLAGQRAWTSFVRGEVIPGSIPWPIWLTYALVAGGTLLLVLRLLVNGLGHSGAAIGRGSGPDLPSSMSGH